MTPEPYEDAAHATDASRLGMWVFLASELMLFAGLFGMYGAQRAHYPDAFRAATAHAELAIGTVNTVILLTSSLTVALAVHATRSARPRLTALLLGASMALGAGFIVLKGIEYGRHFREGIEPGAAYHFGADPGVRVFFQMYYLLTGLHTLHVAAGIALLGWAAARSWRGGFGPGDDDHTGLELGGLYWHFVDLVWLFLWPLFYLLR
jgi:cytochrome c oxidase subunit 3